jgi:hypothetical protein
MSLMRDQGPSWPVISLAVTFLLAASTFFVTLATRDNGGEALWWWLGAAFLGLAGLTILVVAAWRPLQRRWKRSDGRARGAISQSIAEQNSGTVFDHGWADQASKREQAMYGARSDEWNFFHFAWPAELGGPAVWLEAHGPEHDRRLNVWCLVQGPDGTSRERDMSSAFTGPPNEPMPVDVEWRYPHDFPGGAEVPYLKEGRYQVEWRAQSGVGRGLVGTDCFLVEQGQVKDCDGKPSPVIDDYSDS